MPTTTEPQPEQPTDEPAPERAEPLRRLLTIEDLDLSGDSNVEAAKRPGGPLHRARQELEATGQAVPEYLLPRAVRGERAEGFWWVRCVGDAPARAWAPKGWFVAHVRGFAMAVPGRKGEIECHSRRWEWGPYLGKSPEDMDNLDIDTRFT